MASQFADEHYARARYQHPYELPSYYTAWLHVSSFHEALVEAKRTMISHTRSKLWEEVIVHWRLMLRGCTWRRQFYEDLVAFDECRDVRHTSETVNLLLFVAVCLSRCDLVRVLAPHFQPTMKPDHTRILLAIHSTALLPVIDLLLNLHPLERAADVICHLATVEYLPVSFFALRCFTDYQLVRYAPTSALPLLESYGVDMESERHLIELLTGPRLSDSRARFHAARASSETAIALAKRSIAYFVLFDRATHDKLRRRVRYATSSCTYGWFRLLCADDLRVLEASRTSDYCALDHIPPALLDAARRRT